MAQESPQRRGSGSCFILVKKMQQRAGCLVPKENACHCLRVVGRTFDADKHLFFISGQRGFRIICIGRNRESQLSAIL